MNQLDLREKDLSQNIASMISWFNECYLMAIDDNVIDDTEYNRLAVHSKKIKEAIESENKELISQIQKKQQKKAKTGSGLTILGGILLVAGAAIGIKALKP